MCPTGYKANHQIVSYLPFSVVSQQQLKPEHLLQGPWPNTVLSNGLLCGPHGTEPIDCSQTFSLSKHCKSWPSGLPDQNVVTYILAHKPIYYRWAEASPISISSVVISCSIMEHKLFYKHHKHLC